MVTSQALSQSDAPTRTLRPRCIRAMALGEVAIKDWWRIIRREISAGFALGMILATIGFLRILAWQGLFGTYGAHYGKVAVTVAASLVAVGHLRYTCRLDASVRHKPTWVRSGKRVSAIRRITG